MEDESSSINYKELLSKYTFEMMALRKIHEANRTPEQRKRFIWLNKHIEKLKGWRKVDK